MTPLPVCKWRGPPTCAGHFGCSSPRLVVRGCGVPEAFCLKCPYADSDVRPASAKRRAARPPCSHLGPATGEAVACAPCGGKTRLKVFGCSLHGECTIVPAGGGRADCRNCRDYRPQE